MNNGPRRSLRDSSQPVTIHSVGLTNFSNSTTHSSVARPLAFAGSEIPDGAAVKSSYLSNRVELGVSAPLLDRPVMFSAEPSQLVHFTHAQPGDGAELFHALNNHSQRYVTESTPVVKLSQSTSVGCSGTVRPGRRRDAPRGSRGPASCERKPRGRDDGASKANAGPTVANLFQSSD